MLDQRNVAVIRWPGQTPFVEKGLPALLAAYHLKTEAEKGDSVADVAALPDKYRAEISDPQSAFADDAVLVAVRGDTAVGCVVVTAADDDGRSEIKRLWTDPAFRSHGVATALLEAALAHAADSGVSTVRLSVWQWRNAAVALYQRLGFVFTDSWDERDQLVCMERDVLPSGGHADKTFRIPNPV